MSSSGYQKSRKKDFYLLEDRFFGACIYQYYHGGRETLAFVVIAHVIPICYFSRKCYLSDQSWDVKSLMFLWLLPSLLTPLFLNALSYEAKVRGRNDVGSDAVFLHVLREVNERCSNGSALKWRQIAHSANKYSEELGESPMVFYSGMHCMRYIDNCAADVLRSRRSLFEDKPLEVVKHHKDIAKSVAEKHKARLEFFSDELKSYSIRPALWLDFRREEAGCKARTSLSNGDNWL